MPPVRTPRPPGPPPDAAALREAALTHLARFGTTQAGLLRVLNRRVDRWVRAAEGTAEQAQAARLAAAEVVARLAAAGVVDDAGFAEARARRLHRAGRSQRAIAAHLQARGVPASLAAQAPDPEAELDAALLYASRRRLGPFRQGGAAAERMKDLARLARAGFTGEVAHRLLAMDPAQAADRVILARQG